VPTLGTSGSPTGVDGDDDAVRVFMSYRRTDDANFTGRFHDKLIGVFGDANVFRDIDSIPAGTKFEDVITARLADVDAVVALIGSTWDARIGSPSDFVRMEIAHALQSDTPVIPVLIEDTPLPTPDGLPDDLKPMLDRQTVRVRRDPDFHRDAARVIDGVREAVVVQRERAAAARRVAEEAARAEREAEQRRQAEIARRKELEAELARADALAEEERRAAEALAAERSQRLAELARLEEEATQRRIADERARVAEIVESHTARAREADAAAARAAELRRELAGYEAVALTAATAEVEPEAVAPVAAAQLAMNEAEPTAATVETEVTDTDPSTAPTIDPIVVEPAVETVAPPAAHEHVAEPGPPSIADTPADATVTHPPQRQRVAGRRTLASASKSELVGATLLVVATGLAVRALFKDSDGSNAFAEHWATDFLALLLTAALLTPLLVFHLGGHVAAVTAGTSVGYLLFQGLSDEWWFWDDSYDPIFPQHMVVIAIVLAGAWFAFRRGSPRPRAVIAHRPSYYLQIAAGVAVLVTVLMYCDLESEWFGYDPIYLYVLSGVSVGVVILGFRRSEEATIVLGTLAAEYAVWAVAIAIAYDHTQDRAMNVAIAAAVLAGTALWRARRAVPVASG
jgi:hypothetical protein